MYKGGGGGVYTPNFGFFTFSFFKPFWHPTGFPGLHVNSTLIYIYTLEI